MMLLYLCCYRLCTGNERPTGAYTATRGWWRRNVLVFCWTHGNGRKDVWNLTGSHENTVGMSWQAHQIYVSQFLDLSRYFYYISFYEEEGYQYTWDSDGILYATNSLYLCIITTKCFLIVLFRQRNFSMTAKDTSGR